MKKLNCWEYKQCDREEGGLAACIVGICPAYRMKKADGINGGKNGGRACWVIVNNPAYGDAPGTAAAKMHNCVSCGFYKLVKKEEGPNFKSAKDILSVLNSDNVRVGEEEGDYVLE